MRILLVEDNRPLAEWLARTLRNSKYSVACAYDGAQADHLLYVQSYLPVILDLALPQLNGHEVLRRLRACGNDVPVLILTANKTIDGRLTAVDTGADDSKRGRYSRFSAAQGKRFVRVSRGLGSNEVRVGKGL